MPSNPIPSLENNELNIVSLSNPKFSLEKYGQLINFLSTNPDLMENNTDKQLITDVNTLRLKLSESISSRGKAVGINLIFSIVCCMAGLVTSGYVNPNTFMEVDAIANCEKKQYFDLNSCQAYFDRNLQDTFIIRTLLSAFLGFFIKSIDQYLAMRFNEILLKNASRILRKLARHEPLTASERFNYLMWRILGYRDLPILSTGIALAINNAKMGPLHLDLNSCISRNMSMPCLVEKGLSKLADTKGITIAEGFLFAFSMLSLSICLYKLIEIFCRQARKAYSSNNNNRLFTHVEQNDSHIAMNENNIIKLDDAPTISPPKF